MDAGLGAGEDAFAGSDSRQAAERSTVEHGEGGNRPPGVGIWPWGSIGDGCRDCSGGGAIPGGELSVPSPRSFASRTPERWTPAPRTPALSVEPRRGELPDLLGGPSGVACLRASPRAEEGIDERGGSRGVASTDESRGSARRERNLRSRRPDASGRGGIASARPRGFLRQGGSGRRWHHRRQRRARSRQRRRARANIVQRGARAHVGEAGARGVRQIRGEPTSRSCHRAPCSPGGLSQEAKGSWPPPGRSTCKRRSPPAAATARIGCSSPASTSLPWRSACRT